MNAGKLSLDNTQSLRILEHKTEQSYADNNEQS